MKAQDLKTIETFIAEYGMKPGVSTPVGDQQTGHQAKATKQASKGSTTQRPTNSPNLVGKKTAQQPEQPEVSATPVGNVKPGTKIKTADGDLEIVGKVDNDNQVVAKDDQGNYATIDAAEKVVTEADRKPDPILKRKHKLKNRIKQLLRATKHVQQGEPVFEINFNNAEVVKSALDAPISCGFEAEVAFPDLPGGGYSEDEVDWDEYTWYQLDPIINNQYGSEEVNKIADSFYEWIWESDQYAEAYEELIEYAVRDEYDSSYYLNEFISSDAVDEVFESVEDRWEEFKKTYFAENPTYNEADALEDFIEEDIEAKVDYKAWVEEQIRDAGDINQEAWDQVESEYGIDNWAADEHGGWTSALHEHSVYLVDEDAYGSGGLEGVEELLSDWARTSSYAKSVRTGGYHDNAGDTEQDYWRIEDDSSIQSDSGGALAELISPVYSSPRQMLAEMKSLFDMLEEHNAETNTSTGLHVTMSMSQEAGDTDPLKMAVLLGDQYLLKTFDREFNTYTSSQQKGLMRAAERLDPNEPVNSETLATIERIIGRGIDYGKFTSINFKDTKNNAGNKLIEFRIGGGDDYHTDFDKAAKAVIRYGATMQTGHDAELNRKDYIRALIKLINKASNGISDAERAELDKTAGLVDVEQTVFLDLLKTLSSKEHYLDNVEAYQRAVNGDVDAAHAVMYKILLNKYETGKPEASARVIRAMRTGFKEMGITPESFFKWLMPVALNQSDFGGNPVEYYNGTIKAAQELLKQPVRAPDISDKVLSIPGNTTFLMPKEQVAAIKNGGDYDLSTAVKVYTSDWEQFLRDFKVVISDLIHEQDPAKKAELEKQYYQSIKQANQKFGVELAGVETMPTGGNYVSITPFVLRQNLRRHPTKPMSVVIAESAFDRFDSLTLNEQLAIISQVDKTKIDEAWNKTQKLMETIEAEQDMAALLTAYGTPKKKKKKAKENCEHGTYYCSTDKKTKCRKSPKKTRNVKEGAVPDHNVKRDYAEIMNKPLLGSDIQGQMQAYFVVPDPSMIRDFRAQIASAGKDVDLRATFKVYAERQLHPKQQAQIAESKLNEYDDLNTEKQNLIQTISGLDASNEKEAQLLDRIYKLLNSERINTTIGTAFNRPLADETMTDAEKQQIMQDMTKIIGGLDSDYGTVNKFIKQLETAGSVVNLSELAKPLNTFANVFTDPIAMDAMRALATYGVGKKQKGPGEYALAILSDKIRLASGEGDLEVEGIGKVELKAALTTAGGRIGYGGGSQKAKRAVIDKYAQYIPTVIASIGGTGGSLGLSKFIPALNADLPVTDINNQKIRRAIATELLQMDLEQFAKPVVDTIATSEDIVTIEDAYLRQNFEWYKNRDDFDALLLMHIPNRKTAMIRTADDLIKFRRSGHSNATSISVIPTQAGAGREQWAQLTLNKGTV